MSEKKSVAACAVKAIEKYLAEGSPGASSVTVDGMTFSMRDRNSAVEELQYWRRRLAKERGRRPYVQDIRLY